MLPHFCPSCSKRFEIPDHYLGRTVTCPNCRHEFTASATTRRPPAPEPVVVTDVPNKQPSDLSARFQPNWWDQTTSSMKGAVIVAAILIVALLVGVPVFRSSQKTKEFKAKYEEFVFEADQLANLTSYGVNKGDFTRQLARVEAKWDAIPGGGFRDGAYSKFYDSMSKWREAVRYWDFDSDWMRDQVPLKMTQASDRYNEAKRAMR